MSVTLTLAQDDDLDRLTRLVGAYHAHAGIEQDAEATRAALEPLLGGTPHGVAYLIGPPKSPVGYIVISFGWSVTRGGLTGTVDEFFIREGVRGRGMGSEALSRLMPALARHGLKALHLEVPQDAPRAHALYKRLGFRARDGRLPLTRMF
ncbi:GNAT family N-acetyltransferase [Tranquillimonas alkanivorans]|uniref:Acetyltransferase (GNAT) family protein n=1 Tax=Tranquillimonas alkanivorans TaxID=441119 RepID=A0A1I5MHK9_9RHOB|nr:GNAT family N-acetyltransferase [Tranquillimonas alkanivorans]SFP09118.1 Acetyltransferase (GNAT) family protein [Tranquillimonas alkanivorans]